MVVHRSIYNPVLKFWWTSPHTHTVTWLHFEHSNRQSGMVDQIHLQRSRKSQWKITELIGIGEGGGQQTLTSGLLHGWEENRNLVENQTQSLLESWCLHTLQAYRILVHRFCKLCLFKRNWAAYVSPTEVQGTKDVGSLEGKRWLVGIDYLKRDHAYEKLYWLVMYRQILHDFEATFSSSVLLIRGIASEILL